MPAQSVLTIGRYHASAKLICYRSRRQSVAHPLFLSAGARPDGTRPTVGYVCSPVISDYS
uniref:hypothetical protein n=1 Tax=Parapedobacter soli TaxID=416955 RepID=UPI0036F1A8DE